MFKNILKLTFFTIVLMSCSGFKCNPAEEWNQVFNRNSFVADSRGWVSGDAARFTKLPNGKFLWAFGDSKVTKIDVSSNQVIIQNPRSRDGVFGTILAIQESSPINSSNIRFFARFLETNAVRDITSGLPSLFSQDGGSSSFFNEAILNIPDITPNTSPVFWPHGLACIDCEHNPQVVLMLKETVFCNPQNSIYDCRPFCVLSNIDGSTDSSTTCTNGLASLRNVIVKILNPNDDIKNWQFQSVIVEPVATTAWGVDFMERYGWVYVYGTQERPGGGVFDMIVSRTLKENVMNPNEWEVLTENGWVKKLENPTPKIVATDVSTMFSVDSIVSNNRENFLLVHDRPLKTHLTFVRPSNSQISWEDTNEKTPRVDKFSADLTLQSSVESAIAAGNCSPFLDIITAKTCVPSYHASVYKELSVPQGDQDILFPSVKTLLFGFIVPRGPADGSNSADYDKPRFGTIDIAKVKPWCIISHEKCWRGVNHVFPALELTDSEITSINFNVVDSDSFVLESFSDLSTYNLRGFVDFAEEVDIVCEFDENTESSFCFVNNLEDNNVFTLQLSSVAPLTIITFRASYDGNAGI